MKRSVRMSVPSSMVIFFCRTISLRPTRPVRQCCTCETNAMMKHPWQDAHTRTQVIIPTMHFCTINCNTPTGTAYHHGYWATNSSKPWPSMHLNWLDWCLGACSSLPDGGCSLQSTHMLFLSAKEVALAFVSPVCFCQSLCQLRPERSKILMDSRR